MADGSRPAIGAPGPVGVEVDFSFAFHAEVKAATRIYSAGGRQGGPTSCAGGDSIVVALEQNSSAVAATPVVAVTGSAGSAGSEARAAAAAARVAA
eukprot:scaffold46043_cov48-Phaeocystis_antarctica.AAC.1